jgi:hypothetical protein
VSLSRALVTEPCLVVDATHMRFLAPAPRHESGSRPHAPDPTAHGAIRGHATPPAVGGDTVPVPFPGVRLLSLKTPLFADSSLPPPSSAILLSPLSSPPVA